MTTETEALRLADELEDSLYSADGTSLSRYCQGIADEAAEEMRRLHEVEKQRDELLAALKLVSETDLEGADSRAMYFIFEAIKHKARATINKAERTTT